MFLQNQYNATSLLFLRTISPSSVKILSMPYVTNLIRNQAILTGRVCIINFVWPCSSFMAHVNIMVLDWRRGCFNGHAYLLTCIKGMLLHEWLVQVSLLRLLWTDIQSELDMNINVIVSFFHADCFVCRCREVISS